MIQFYDMPRLSGKTQITIQEARKTGGFYVLNDEELCRKTRKTVPDNSGITFVTGNNLKYKIRGFGNCYLYFDDFNFNKDLTYEDIILLDHDGHDIVIRGTMIETVPKYFMDYLAKNYPEYCI